MKTKPNELQQDVVRLMQDDAGEWLPDQTLDEFVHAVSRMLRPDASPGTDTVLPALALADWALCRAISDMPSDMVAFLGHCHLAPQDTVQHLRDTRTAYINATDQPVRFGLTVICPVEAWQGEYVGVHPNGVWFDTARGADGWYVSAVIASDEEREHGPLFTDRGPFKTEADAHEAGHIAATLWCIEHGYGTDNLQEGG